MSTIQQDGMIGKKIEITESQTPYFSKGDVGVVKDVDRDGDYIVDFNAQGNDGVYEDGMWYVGPEQCRAIEE